MSISKTAATLAVALTFVGAAPALAHNNLNDWMSMMQRLRQQSAQPAASSAVTHRATKANSVKRTRTLAPSPFSAFASDPSAPNNGVQAGPKRSITPGTRP